MYLGPTTVSVKRYGQEYKPGFGSFTTLSAVVKETHHAYQCEGCGASHVFPEAAEERFFCRTCQHLVAIEVAA
jgi:ribosomal protein L37AE/L43A